MALPIVTYGKYNYGQYANPTPIRYKGGFGEALTGAVQAISTAEKKKKAQFKEAQETSLMMSMQFSSQLNTAFGKAAATNRKFLRDLKQEYGDTVKSYKLGNLSFDDYEDRMTYYQNILDQSMQLAGIMKPIIESDTDVTFDMARSDDDNQAATLARHGVRKGLYILERDEDGMRVVLPHGPSASNYEPKSIAASELITNTKYINPELKYDNNKNPKYAPVLQAVGQRLKNYGELLNSRTEKFGSHTYEFFALNPDQRENAINKILQNNVKNGGNYLMSVFNDEQEKRTYYEDEIGGLNSWKGTDDQINQLKEKLANDLFDTLSETDLFSEKLANTNNNNNNNNNSDSNVFSSIINDIYSKHTKKNVPTILGGTTNYTNYDNIVKELNMIKSQDGFVIRKDKNNKYFMYNTGSTGNIATGSSPQEIDIKNMEDVEKLIMGKMLTSTQLREFLLAKTK